MNKEDIIRMAHESFDVQTDARKRTTFSGDSYAIERFAALVMSAECERLIDVAIQAAEKSVDVAIALEREACAKIVESDPSYDWHKFACEAANAIRARGQA